MPGRQLDPLGGGGIFPTQGRVLCTRPRRADGLGERQSSRPPPPVLAPRRGAWLAAPVVAPGAPATPAGPVKMPMPPPLPLGGPRAPARNSAPLPAASASIAPIAAAGGQGTGGTAPAWRPPTAASAARPHRVPSGAARARSRTGAPGPLPQGSTASTPPGNSPCSRPAPPEHQELQAVLPNLLHVLPHVGPAREHQPLRAPAFARSTNAVLHANGARSGG